MPSGRGGLEPSSNVSFCFLRKAFRKTIEHNEGLPVPAGRPAWGPARRGLSHPLSWELPSPLSGAPGGGCRQTLPWIRIFSSNFSHLSGHHGDLPANQTQGHVADKRVLVGEGAGCAIPSSRKFISARQGPLGLALRRSKRPTFHGLLMTWGTQTVPHVLTSVCLAN